MFGQKGRIRLGRLNSLASCCSDSQAEFSGVLGANLRFKQVDREAVEYWQEYWVPNSKRAPPEGGWDWRQIDQNARAKVNELCIAMWHESTILCGLCVLSIYDNSVRVEAVEGNPDASHPLKSYVIPIAIDITERLANKLSRAEVWLVDPADGLLDMYVNELGFTLYETGKRKVCKRRV